MTTTPPSDVERAREEAHRLLDLFESVGTDCDRHGLSSVFTLQCKRVTAALVAHARELAETRSRLASLDAAWVSSERSGRELRQQRDDAREERGAAVERASKAERERDARPHPDNYKLACDLADVAQRDLTAARADLAAADTTTKALWSDVERLAEERDAARADRDRAVEKRDEWKEKSAAFERQTDDWHAFANRRLAEREALKVEMTILQARCEEAERTIRAMRDGVWLHDPADMAGPCRCIRCVADAFLAPAQAAPAETPAPMHFAADGTIRHPCSACSVDECGCPPWPAPATSKTETPAPAPAEAAVGTPTSEAMLYSDGSWTCVCGAPHLREQRSCSNCSRPAPSPSVAPGEGAGAHVGRGTCACCGLSLPLYERKGGDVCRNCALGQCTHARTGEGEAPRGPYPPRKGDVWRYLRTELTFDGERAADASGRWRGYDGSFVTLWRDEEFRDGTLRFVRPASTPDAPVEAQETDEEVERRLRAITEQAIKDRPAAPSPAREAEPASGRAKLSGERTLAIRACNRAAEIAGMEEGDEEWTTDGVEAVAINAIRLRDLEHAALAVSTVERARAEKNYGEGWTDGVAAGQRHGKATALREALEAVREWRDLGGTGRAKNYFAAVEDCIRAIERLVVPPVAGAR